MRQKKWKEKIGGNSELIIIGALIILSIILAADHLFNLPRLLSGAPPEQFEWGELVFDLVAIFCIGLISFILVRKSEAERREVEQIRWREKDKAQEYLDVAGVILLAINAEQKVTLINRKGCEILGYEEEEITGKNWFDQFVPEWDRERVRAAFVRLMPGGHKAAEYFENPVLTKSGEERIIAWHNTLLTDETGNITGTLSSGEDITERKKTEEALQEERNKLQAIIDSMEYGLTIQDRDYNIIFQNEALKGLFGNQLGEKCYQAYEFRDEICDGCPVRMAWADGKPHTAERKIMWKSGEIMFWENTANPIRDTRGEIVACLEIARNITERKKAEETLRESQAKLQSIFSAVPAGIGMTTNQTIRELNARLCEITGYSKEELLGKSISVVYPSDQDYLSARCEIYDQLREKGYSTIEASWKRKDGKLISVLLNCALLKPGDFSQGITFTVLDISERKKAEKTLGQSEERYRELFDNMGSGVAVYEAIDKGKDFMFKGFNRAGEQIEKVEKESLIGKTILEIFSDAENFPLLKVFERVWRTGKPERASTEVRKDQIIVGWRENYIYRLPTGEMVSIFEDITERKRVEEALRESEEKYKALIEAAGRAGEGIIIIQDNGVEEAAFVFVNEQFCRMSGYSQEELLGRSSWDFIPHEIAVRLRDWYKRRHMGESLPSHYEAAGVHKDGTIVPLELSIVTMPWQGKIATVLYIRDITERKKAEETIRTERDKLENVTRNIGVGLATISKDYQTIWANEVLKQIFGEVEGKLCYNTYNGRTNICPGCGVREVFEQGKDVSVHEQVGKDKDGNTIWSQIIATPLRDKEGNITASMEVVVPITERKKAEERLKAEKEFSEKLISTTNAIIVGLDKEHRILLFNQGAERITGYKVKEIIGKDWFKIFFKEEMYPEMIRVWKDAWGKDSHVHTNLICSKSGKEIIAQWSNTSIMDGAGEPIMLLCIAVDITERKKAEEALRESEEKHRTYIENAPYGIFIVDSEARYIDVNEAACRMTGYSRDELLNMTIMQLAPSDTSPELLEPFEKLKRHGKTSSEIVIQRKDASVIHASLDAVALSDGRFIAFCSDITRRKKAEEEIENLAKFPSENPDPILRISKDGIILYTNDSSLSLLDEWGTFVNQNAPDYLKQSVTEIFNTGLTKNIEIEHQGRILSFIVVPVHGTDYVNFYGRDITQSKKAEEALRTSEEKYRAIVENATDQIFTLDRQCRFLAINKTAAEISRKSVSEMVGKSLLLIFPKETAAQFQKISRKCLKPDRVNL